MAATGRMGLKAGRSVADGGCSLTFIICNKKKGLDKQKKYRKIVIIFLPISFNICFGWSKEPSH